MPARDELHRLVDTLPEGALDTAKRMLEHMHLPTPPAIERIRRERELEARRAMRPGTVGGFGAGGLYTTGPGGELRHGHHGSTHWDGDTQVAVTHRFHYGHEVKITERMLLDGDVLVYTHIAAAPDGEEHRQELRFKVG